VGKQHTEKKLARFYAKSLKSEEFRRFQLFDIGQVRSHVNEQIAKIKVKTA
jgi:hypothetical protein